MGDNWGLTRQLGVDMLLTWRTRTHPHIKTGSIIYEKCEPRRLSMHAVRNS